jgi:hypothetical protein
MPFASVRLPPLLLLAAWACASDDSLAVVRGWLPLAVGDRWVYQEELRGGDRQHPDIRQWQQSEETVAVETVPEGVLIRRKVVFLDNTLPPRWIRARDESNILVHDDCLYYLEVWPPGHDLGAEFRQALATGEALPDVCFPLQAGKTWGDPNKGRDLWTVAGRGPKNAGDPDSASVQSWRLEAHLASGDDNYVWFQQGIGITAARTFHNGTYNDQRIRLLRFEPAKPPTPEP